MKSFSKPFHSRFRPQLEAMEDRIVPTALSISDDFVNEGQKAVFVVTLSEPVTHAVTVDFSTVDKTATGGSDYLHQSGTLTFKPGETSKTIRIRTINDKEIETNPETFYVQLSNAIGADLDDDRGLGGIYNDDFVERGHGRDDDDCRGLPRSCP